MEVRENNVREARSLYKRCHAKQLQDGGQLSLCQAWQRFEREHGEPEDHFQACLKTEPLISKVTSQSGAATNAKCIHIFTLLAVLSSCDACFQMQVVA